MHSCGTCGGRARPESPESSYPSGSALVCSAFAVCLCRRLQPPGAAGDRALAGLHCAHAVLTYTVLALRAALLISECMLCIERRARRNGCTVLCCADDGREPGGARLLPAGRPLQAHRDRAPLGTVPRRTLYRTPYLVPVPVCSMHSNRTAQHRLTD